MGTMKKIALSAFVIISFLLYSLGMRGSGSSLPSATGGTPASSGPEPGGTAATGSGSGNGSEAQTGSSAGYKDGAYTGPVADAFYGNIQVQAIIKDGRLSDVRFLQYPDDQPNSVAINKQAMPYLRKEALQAQSAQVDGVSGATDTSLAFNQSLSAALRQAM
jgi:uncharacterized protein with FMN-binding domain